MTKVGRYGEAGPLKAEGRNFILLGEETPDNDPFTNIQWIIQPGL